MTRILLAEDDEIMRISIYDRLVQSGWKVDEAENGNQAFELFTKNNYNLVISDIKMPGMSGLSLLKKIKENNSDTDIIIMTAFGSVDDAMDCLRQGASDYILKPFDMDNLIIRATRLLEAQRVKKKYELLEAAQPPGKELIGSGPAMQEVFSIINQAAPSNATILITGESGTGKELAARAIHRLSPRKDEPFISINCAAIPEGLMESEMFGHERGSFTGADKKRKGKFELADKGTLLLDELGDLPGPLQAKLLRVIEESVFERVGGNQSINVDVRILACTSKDLQVEVDQGRFRRDLLYRLQVIPITMPPLRDHKEDISRLCQSFLQEFSPAHSPKTINDNTLSCLSKYHFPGNVRELKNLMERASVLSQGPEITPKDLPADICSGNSDCGETFNLSDNLAKAEQCIIKKALLHTDGNKTKSAELLGISRKNLWEKMNKFKM